MRKESREPLKFLGVEMKRSGKAVQFKNGHFYSSLYREISGVRPWWKLWVYCIIPSSWQAWRGYDIQPSPHQSICVVRETKILQKISLFLKLISWVYRSVLPGFWDQLCGPRWSTGCPWRSCFGVNTQPLACFHELVWGPASPEAGWVQRHQWSPTLQWRSFSCCCLCSVSLTLGSGWMFLATCQHPPSSWKPKLGSTWPVLSL